MNERLILIVDDEPRICAELAGYLSQKGYHTVIADNGHDAYNLFISEMPVCVLTDYRMPKMDGLELLKKIKHNNHGIHVILMSGVADIKTVAEAMKNEAFDFLGKPIDLKNLLDLVNIAVRKTVQSAKKQIDDRISSVIFHKALEENEKVSLLFFNKDIDEQMKDKYNRYIRELMNERILRDHVVFHLENAKYINNIGLNFLIDVKETLTAAGKQTYLCSLADQVSTYIRTLGYNNYFTIEKNIGDVLERIRSGI